MDRLRDIVLTALEMAGPDRQAYLATACVGNPDLQREAERLLATDPDATEALEAGLANIARELSAAASPAIPESGDVLGPYRLERCLGTGGSGTVFEAVQESPVRRHVAVKLLHRNRPLSADLARFRAEQQILAHLDHPNIARVLDAGTTAEGMPYFVLELIRGEPINRYARNAGLDLAARVSLCLQACRAAEHAHAKGIIHRDLKPSNILVSSTPEGPLVKVIDFGIARLLEGDAGQTLTLEGLVLGTPEYMSPEQAVGGSADCDVKTDVHALGNLVHELLCGHGIYNVGTLSTSMQLRAVAAGRRELSTRDVEGKSLPTDLRRIIAMATEPERELRYRTVAALAEDLESFLERRPVKARGAGKWYLLRKAAERHPYSATLLVVLTIVVFGSLVALLNLNGRERAAVMQAQAESARSASLAAYLKGMMESADPTRQGPGVTMVQAFGEAARRAEGDLADDPGTLTEVLGTIAAVQFALDDNEAALATLLRAEAACARDPQHTAAALVGMPLGRVPYLYAMGRNASADSIIERTIAVTRGRRDLADVEVNALLAKGGRDFIRGAYVQGDSAATAARALLLSLPDPGRGRLVYTQRVRAICRVNFGSRSAAIELLRGELTACERDLGDGSPITIGLMGDLAYALGPENGAERVDLQRRGLDGVIRLIGPEHIDAAKHENNLAAYLAGVGRGEEAAPLAERALRIWKARYGHRHPQVALAYGTVGYVALVRGDNVAAVKNCEESLAIYGLLNEPGLAVNALAVRNNLTVALLREKRWAEAEAQCRSGLGATAAPYLGHPNVGWARGFLGSVLLATGRLSEAVAEFEAAKRVNAAQDPPLPALAALVECGLGQPPAEGEMEPADRCAVLAAESIAR